MSRRRGRDSGGPPIRFRFRVRVRVRFRVRVRVRVRVDVEIGEDLLDRLKDALSLELGL